jgi:hypothetical protein
VSAHDAHAASVRRRGRRKRLRRALRSLPTAEALLDRTNHRVRLHVADHADDRFVGREMFPRELHHTLARQPLDPFGGREDVAARIVAVERAPQAFVGEHG